MSTSYVIYEFMVILALKYIRIILEQVYIMSTLKFGLIACFSSLLCLNAYAATTQVYTWTDEAGVVHYSETPPKNKEQTSELVTTKTHSGTPAAPVAEAKAGSSKETDTLPAKQEVEQVLKKNPEACKQATTALNSLMSKPIIRSNGKIMSIKEKNQEIQNLKDIMKIHC